MRRRTKVWLITAAALVLIGLILFAGVMTKLGWDFMSLATVKYETNTYEISEEFDNVSINTDVADIKFALSEDDKCKVECLEEEKVNHSVTVKDGTLTIELIDERGPYDFIGLRFDSPEITVYLPKTEYTSLLIKGDTADVEMPDNFTFEEVDISLSTGDVDFCASASRMIKIKTSTGSISLEGISSGLLDLSVSTGKVTLTDINCKNVISSGDTGDISFERVIAEEKFSVQRSTGDVKFNGCDAAEIYVKTDTGDVAGSLLSDKIFVTETDTGNVQVPNSVTGGRCEIATNTGNIKIEICS